MPARFNKRGGITMMMKVIKVAICKQHICPYYKKTKKTIVYIGAIVRFCHHPDYDVKTPPVLKKGERFPILCPIKEEIYE